MSKRTAINELLSVRGLKFECPNSACGEQSSIKRAALFDIRDGFPRKAAEIMAQRFIEAQETHDENVARRDSLERNKIDKPQQIERGARSSNFGKQMEHVIPAFLTFPYRREECRVILQPVDYIHFKGLSNNGKIEVIKFVEVKTGGGRLTSDEACVQSAVASGSILHNRV